MKKILFIDFDGTICHDYYWRSLPGEQYKSIQKFLFQDRINIVMGWMRGEHTAEEINHLVADHLKISFESLWEVFIKDCKSMHVEQRILDKLTVLRSEYILILITGNMDSFSRFTVPALQLEEYFDIISNSFDEKLLKTDNDGELF